MIIDYKSYKLKRRSLMSIFFMVVVLAIALPLAMLCIIPNYMIAHQVVMNTAVITLLIAIAIFFIGTILIHFEIIDNKHKKKVITTEEIAVS